MTRTDDSSEKRQDTVGRPLAGQELRIESDDQSGRSGQVGEVQWRGANKSYGFLNDPEGTRQVWGDDGWLRSGDLGYLDADGYLHLVGRKKDMIIRGGQNVNPGLIEDVLVRHPLVSEVAVVSFPDLARYLPEILRGEVMHGIGYSEPEAGSDLAALRTRARREGDCWVISGQKIWTTTYWGRYMFLAARTGPDTDPKHLGISVFIVPMATAGITVRPARTLYDGLFANIFYDEVRLDADALIGEENQGWKVVVHALATERGLVGGGIVFKVMHLFERLCRHVKLAVPPLPQERMAQARADLSRFAAEIEVGRRLALECARRVEDGVTPPAYAAMSKVYSGELMEPDPGSSPEASRP